MIKPGVVNTHGNNSNVSEKTKINVIFQEEQTVDINEAISTDSNPPTDDQISSVNQGITDVEDKIAESPAEMTQSPIPAWHFFLHSIFLISTVYFSKKKFEPHKMIYSRMDNNFELVPIEIKGVTGWIYLYLRSFVGWILSFFDIYEIKEGFFHKNWIGRLVQNFNPMWL